MELVLQTEAPPLRRDSSGGMRVGNSRVLLELIIRAFEDGATAEAICQRYETVTLAEVYSVVAYYLRHPDEIALYMQQREEQAKSVREHIEGAQPDLIGVRKRLQARRKMIAS